MKRAIIKTGGKQYVVAEGDKLKVEKIKGITEKDQPVTFDVVLGVFDDKTHEVTLGTPVVKGAKVEAVVTKIGRYPKITVIKYKAKVNYKRTIGHKQAFVEVQIKKIS